MYRIHRSGEPGARVFALSGVLDGELATRLQELLGAEADGPFVLDLKDVTLVDRDAVLFLSRTEAAGTAIVNCPEYVRRWITAEENQ